MYKSKGIYGFINMEMLCEAIINKKAFPVENLAQNEYYIDKCEARLSSYMVGINDKSLSEEGKRMYAEMMHAIGDFERIGDYAANLLDQYEYISERQLDFSEEAQQELVVMYRAAQEILNLTNDAHANAAAQVATRVEAL